MLLLNMLGIPLHILVVFVVLLDKHLNFLIDNVFVLLHSPGVLGRSSPVSRGFAAQPRAGLRLLHAFFISSGRWEHLMALCMRVVVVELVADAAAI